MRRLTSTLVLAVILAALGGYIYFVELKKPATSGPVKEKAFTVTADDIEELSIKAAGGETTRLQKAGGGWQMVEPVKADADSAEPTSIASSLSTVEIERVVDENPASVSDYGLDPPRVDVGFRLKGQKDLQHLHIGEKTPTGGDLYARRQNDKRVFLISAFLDNTFNRTSFDLRDKNILKFDRSKVDSVEIVNGPSTLQFVKHGEVEWNVVKPVAARGDFGAIDGVLSTISSTQVQRFIAPEATGLAQYGLDKPTLTVTLAGGGTQSALLIGKSTGEGTYFAKDSNRPIVFSVGENLLKDLRKELNDVRRKDLFEFRPFTANRVEFVRSGGTVALEKTKGKDDADVWKTGTGTQLDTTKAEDPLMKFANLRVESFETTPPPALKSPELTVTAKFDNDKTEIVRFAKVGGDVYAVREGEPGAGKMPAAAYDEAVKALDTIK